MLDVSTYHNMLAGLPVAISSILGNLYSGETNGIHPKYVRMATRGGVSTMVKFGQRKYCA